MHYSLRMCKYITSYRLYYCDTGIAIMYKLHNNDYCYTKYCLILLRPVYHQSLILNFYIKSYCSSATTNLRDLICEQKLWIKVLAWRYKLYW